jgi:hypothetical protein
MHEIWDILKRLVYEKKRFLFYGYDPGQGAGRPDPCVKVYGSWKDIPESFRRRAVPAPWRSAMRHRLRRGKARLLCLSEDGQHLDAYGWIQDWRPFRRRFGALARTGTMLGPYWTAPEARGRGLYGRLLAHSLSICDRDRPILIGTSPENKPSQRGIEKAGFSLRGGWEIRLYLRGISDLRRI